MKFPKYIEMMSRLIGSASVSSVNPSWDMSNQSVIEDLQGWFNSLGFKTEVLAIPGRPGKYNLIASYGQGSEGLVLSGHTDTVPFDEDLWQSDPLQLKEKNQRLYGIGTADMKGFFAIILEAVKELPLEQLKRPLVVLATADEESDMCGAKSLTKLHRQLGRHALIGEPTGLKPVRMHKGVSMESITLTGQSGHSSNPQLGNNALDGMQLVLGEILSWRSDLQRRFKNPAFQVDVPTLNLGHIHGGDNPNRICGSCELQFDLRPLPGMDLQNLRAELQDRLDSCLSDSGLSWQLNPLFDGIPAMETPATAAIVKAVEKITDSQAGAVAFGTEAPYLNDMGMQTVVCGPGHIDQAHQPDEYMPLEHIQPAINLIQSLIRKFCL